MPPWSLWSLGWGPQLVTAEPHVTWESAADSSPRGEGTEGTDGLFWACGSQSAVIGWGGVISGALRQLVANPSETGGRVGRRGEGDPQQTFLQGLPLSPGQRGTRPSPPPPRFLGSLRSPPDAPAPQPQLQPQGREPGVHVHFKEEIGIAELIPLVTTYIILFAYIYFSTRRSTAWRLGLSPR